GGTERERRPASGGDRRSDRSRHVVGHGDDRNRNTLVEAEAAGRDRSPVEDDGGGTGSSGVFHGRDRVVARADERRAAGDAADPARVEERLDRRRRDETPGAVDR